MGTGRVFNVTNRSLGVVASKPVRNRIEKKKICIRAEHVRHSSCRQDFLDRVKRNDTTRRECKKNGTAVPDLKRKPVGPRPAHIVKKSSVVSSWNNVHFFFETSLRMFPFNSVSFPFEKKLKKKIKTAISTFF